MSQAQPLKFVSLLGSLRAGSFNAVVASNLDLLAPEGVEVSALGSVADIPHYDADQQALGFPEAVVAIGKTIAAADGLIIVTPERAGCAEECAGLAFPPAGHPCRR